MQFPRKGRLLPPMTALLAAALLWGVLLGAAWTKQQGSASFIPGGSFRALCQGGMLFWAALVLLTCLVGGQWAVFLLLHFAGLGIGAQIGALILQNGMFAFWRSGAWVAAALAAQGSVLLQTAAETAALQGVLVRRLCNPSFGQPLGSLLQKSLVRQLCRLGLLLALSALCWRSYGIIHGY